MQLKNPDGTPRDVRLLAPEFPDLVRQGLGWALFRPDETVVRRAEQPGCYCISVAGRGVVSPAIPADMMRALLVLRILNPSPDDPQEAVGNPTFLDENPGWRMYIPDPMRRRR